MLKSNQPTAESKTMSTPPIITPVTFYRHSLHEGTLYPTFEAALKGHDDMMAKQSKLADHMLALARAKEARPTLTQYLKTNGMTSLPWDLYWAIAHMLNGKPEDSMFLTQDSAAIQLKG